MRRLRNLHLRIPLVLGLALALGLLWWWAVLRLALVPAAAGPVEGAVAVGGWGLGLLPVHCTRHRAATRASRRRRSGAGSDPS
ncbi:hypothetical protein OHS33_26845 [Streptomyces sp. NBC_00536]|uniref:hypothetical protein n=1 Tax=Streptomyces sp. NBC_00536 TaxID=2975769 RepID=UPI002E800847|nr:hypothetical protein [Streptomyces sp. NBC_00536]WUC81634.1 hypothetical protein OHS33_26845 [Streptomyces sp. NBC_00536]